MMRICVVIPAYNEEKTIGELSRKIKMQNHDVLVVDDGSTDATVSNAQKSGAFVIRNLRNKGKGACLMQGFAFCIERSYDAMVTMDGDGQHLPEEIPYFLNRAQCSKSNVFIGNRMQRTGGMPLSRLLVNRGMSWIISLLTRQRIPDSQCGFRLLKKEAFKTIKLSANRFEIETEILLRASRLGFVIESLPVSSVYAGEKSRIHPFMDTLRFMRFLYRESWTTPS